MLLGGNGLRIGRDRDIGFALPQRLLMRPLNGLQNDVSVETFGLSADRPLIGGHGPAQAHALYFTEVAQQCGRGKRKA